MSKVLVNIHGAGKQMSDFYVEGLAALTGILGAEPACLPCWYADLSNIGVPVFDPEDPSLSPEARDFQAEFGQEIYQRRRERSLPADGEKRRLLRLQRRGARLRGVGVCRARKSVARWHTGRERRV